MGDDGQRRRAVSKKRGFATKKAALEYLPQLVPGVKGIDVNVSFAQMGEMCIDERRMRNVSRSTINCYQAALKHFEEITYCKFGDIGIDDLQECINECPRGKQTRRNMKTIAGLMYKYAIPRGYLQEKVNLSEFLYVTGEEGQEKHPFTVAELETFKRHIGVVPYADYLYALCYLGFRPSEFLALTVDSYNAKERAFVGGSKTAAGIGRTVTISPKVQPIVDRLIQTTQDGHIFHRDGMGMGLKTFREKCFYPALNQMGIQNEDPKRTPHSCRHTFADLMKNIPAADKDKLELIGHSSEEMLRYYQSVNLEDLRKITNSL